MHCIKTKVGHKFFFQLCVLVVIVRFQQILTVLLSAMTNWLLKATNMTDFIRPFRYFWLFLLSFGLIFGAEVQFAGSDAALTLQQPRTIPECRYQCWWRRRRRRLGLGQQRPETGKCLFYNSTTTSTTHLHSPHAAHNNCIVETTNYERRSFGGKTHQQNKHCSFAWTKFGFAKQTNIQIDKVFLTMTLTCIFNGSRRYRRPTEAVYLLTMPKSWCWHVFAFNATW